MTNFPTGEDHGFFRVTADTVSEQSAQDGDFSYSGFVTTLATWADFFTESKWDLREIFDRFHGYAWSGSNSGVPSSVSFTNDNPNDGFSLALMDHQDHAISFSVHRPSWITTSSWVRVCRILGVSVN